MNEKSIITDIAYNNFIFKYQGHTFDKMIYEVYPNKKIDPSDFINEIIYNDKTRFNLSLFLNKGITKINGYLVTEEAKTYKMVIELTIIDEVTVSDSIQDLKNEISSSDFYPITINGIQYPYLIKYYKIYGDFNMETNYIENNVYAVNLSLIGASPQIISGDNIYDAIMLPIEAKFNAEINPTQMIKVEFDSVFFVTKTPVYENSLYDGFDDEEEEYDDEYEEFDGNMTAEAAIEYLSKIKDTIDDALPSIKYNLTIHAYYKINKIDNLKIDYVSTSKLVIEKDDKNPCLPEEIVRYFYHEYCIHRECAHDFDIIRSNIGQVMSSYSFLNTLCLFSKTKLPDNVKNKDRKIARFLKSKFKKDNIINIYKSMNPFSKLKYFGYVYDPDKNFTDAINIISKEETFKRYNIELINETQNYAFIALTKKVKEEKR